MGRRESSLERDLDKLKSQAEKCMKVGQYTEAFLHWSHAIRKSPEEVHYYSQRSKCFLKLEQYYYALIDSETLLKLCPESCLGYLRKAEVMYAIHDYAAALGLYQVCFQKSHQEKDYYLDWMKRCKREAQRESSLDDQYPFVGASVGIVVSVLGVVVDTLMNQEDTWLPHPFLKVAMVITVSFLAFLACKMYRKFCHRSQLSLLEPPIDLLGMGDPASLEPSEEPSSPLETQANASLD